MRTVPGQWRRPEGSRPRGIRFGCWFTKMRTTDLTEAPASSGTVALSRDGPRRVGLERVEGQVTRPTSSRVPITGREPELATDAPAWIVQFEGELRLDPFLVWIDPTCVVVDDKRLYVGTGPVRDLSSGVTMTPPPISEGPDRALPPLQP